MDLVVSFLIYILYPFVEGKSFLSNYLLDKSKLYIDERKNSLDKYHEEKSSSGMIINVLLINRQLLSEENNNNKNDINK